MRGHPAPTCYCYQFAAPPVPLSHSPTLVFVKLGHFHNNTSATGCSRQNSLFIPYFDQSDKKVNYAKSSKKRHLSSPGRGRLGRPASRHSFIPAYSSITIEANSTNGFLTIFQMIKELNKEPVICINGLRFCAQLSMACSVSWAGPPGAAISESLDQLLMATGKM